MTYAMTPDPDTTRPVRIVAVMQPYFFPYAGYFRLLAVADTFVILDDVQFPRRGRVHRCEVPGPGGAVEWLTLPLARQAQNVQIKDLEFVPHARLVFEERLRRLSWLRDGKGPLAAAVIERLRGELLTPLALLEASLTLVADALAFTARRIRSSALEVDHTLRGQAYITALVRAAGGDMYVNAPGGRFLYDPACFAAEGLSLRFLQPYSGRFRYLLPALLNEDPVALRQDILDTTSLST